MRLSEDDERRDLPETAPDLGHLPERTLIGRLIAGAERTDLQVNAPHETDAELIRLPGESSPLLAITTDAISEEIESGLYDEPELVAWMAVAASASDLAAVGAEPLGILLDVTLPREDAPDLVNGLADGLRRSSAAHDLPLLGGDTSSGPTLRLASTALGWIRGARPLTRCGARPGHQLYASGPLGLGSTYALSRLPGLRSGHAPAPPARYRPRGRLSEGRLLRGLASSCIDTSDGPIAAMDELARLSGVGFHLDVGVEATLHPGARRAAAEAGLPPWFMLAGPHGEFELLFTVPPAGVRRLRALAADVDWRPVRLGRVTSRPGLRLAAADGSATLDTSLIRSLHRDAALDPRRYLDALRRVQARSGGSNSAPMDLPKDGAA